MPDLSRYQRWYGRDAPPPDRRAVRAGPLVGELDGSDLRYVRFGDVEVVRRVYAAIRDRDWGTVAPELTNVHLDVGERSFTLRFDARNLDRAMGVDFSWHGEILGAADGSITLSLDGVANVDMSYNRIGWCVLHPAENAGRRFRARTPQALLEARLPLEIGPRFPDPLVPGFDRIEVEVAEATWARFEFEGALFEIEDQRNWTDASFKAYTAPLEGVYTRTAKAGERIRESVRLAVDGVERHTGATDGMPVITIGGPSGSLPAIGVGSASSGAALTLREEELLAAASFDHIRIDIDPDQPGWREQLGAAASAVRALNAALELALFVPEDVELLDSLASALREEGVAVARVLAFRHDELTSSAHTVSLARKHLAAAIGDAPVVGGTNVLFAELNSFRPDTRGVDGIAWPLNATVHASDDTSVVETAAMHGETLRSARAFCDERPLHVTPITLNLRFNPYATGPVAEPGPGELPPQVDPRQPSLLAAGWTVATLRHLAEGGAASVTYFETVGWRGLIECEAGPAVPERFASWPGMVFPVYHVLADVGSWRGGEVIAVEATRPLSVEALAVRTQGVLHVLVASLVPTPQRCRIDGISFGGAAKVRVLDEDSFALACSDPAVYRGRFEPLERAGSSLELELGPYALARVEVSLASRPSNRGPVSVEPAAEPLQETDSGRTVIRRLDHVAIAVKSTHVALRYFRDHLGLRVVHAQDLEQPRIRLTYLDAGNMFIQLIEPLDDDSEVAHSLAQNGEGVHHICFGVDDPLTAAQALSRDGVGVTPGTGRGRVSAFVPGSTHGVRIECTEFDRRADVDETPGWLAERPEPALASTKIGSLFRRANAQRLSHVKRGRS